jgi:hypothetical protein
VCILFQKPLRKLYLRPISVACSAPDRILWSVSRKKRAPSGARIFVCVCTFIVCSPLLRALLSASQYRNQWRATAARERGKEKENRAHYGPFAPLFICMKRSQTRGLIDIIEKIKRSTPHVWANQFRCLQTQKLFRQKRASKLLPKISNGPI